MGEDWSEPGVLEQDARFPAFRAYPGAGIPAAFGLRPRPSAGSPLEELQQRLPWGRLYLQAWKDR